MSTKKVLVIDNTIDQPWKMGRDFIRYIDAGVEVRRAPQRDLPLVSSSFSHIILSGSKTSCLDSSPWVLELMMFLESSIQNGKRILGVCYGHQVLARLFGSESAVQKASKPEYGWVEIEQTLDNPIFDGIPQKFYSFQAHQEEVSKLSSDLIKTAQSERCAIQAFYHKNKPIFGVQFHPERNAAEGEAGFLKAKKLYQADCLFNKGRADSLFTENVANNIFKNFIRI